MNKLKSKIKTEVHAHTMVSQHAYATLNEMIAACREKGLELMALTDHGPAIPDGAIPWHFMCLKYLPRNIDGFYLLHGAEVNIIDYSGGVDLDNELLSRLDWVIASIHRPCLPPGTVEDHTNTYLKVLENPYIDCLGHSGTPAYAYDIEAVVEAAKKYDKVIEINNHTFRGRPQSIENCEKIARACARIGTKVSLGTDAHSTFAVGNTENAWALVEKVGIGEEQIVNLSAKSMLRYLCNRKGWDMSRFEE